MMVYEIDGTGFSTLEEFFAEFGRVVIPQSGPVSDNLDAFDDVLSGGFGTPDEGFTLRWKNHAVSRQRLGYPETVRQLELRFARCHPTNRARVPLDLKEAQAHRGPTVFEWLTEIIRDHGPGGRQAADGVDLLLD
jgi:RNAse (barnase) inhibitor barstar